MDNAVQKLFLSATVNAAFLSVTDPLDSEASEEEAVLLAPERDMEELALSRNETLETAEETTEREIEEVGLARRDTLETAEDGTEREIEELALLRKDTLETAEEGTETEIEELALLRKDTLETAEEATERDIDEVGLARKDTLETAEEGTEMEILLLGSTMALLLWTTSVIAKAVTSPAKRKESKARLSARVENIVNSEKGKIERRNYGGMANECYCFYTARPLSWEPYNTVDLDRKKKATS